MLFIQSYTSLICYPLRFFFLNLLSKYCSINFLAIVISKFLAACAISTFVYTINISFAIILLTVFLSAIILYTKDICVLIRCRLIYTSLDMCYFMKLNFHFDRLHMHRYFYLLFNNLLLLQNCYPYHLQFLLPKPQFPLHKFLHCMLHLIIPHLLPQYLTSSRFLSLHPLPIILISVSLFPKINII